MSDPLRNFKPSLPERCDAYLFRADAEFVSLFTASLLCATDDYLSFLYGEFECQSKQRLGVTCEVERLREEHWVLGGHGQRSYGTRDSTSVLHDLKGTRGYCAPLPLESKYNANALRKALDRIV